MVSIWWGRRGTILQTAARRGGKWVAIICFIIVFTIVPFRCVVQVNSPYLKPLGFTCTFFSSHPEGRKGGERLRDA